MPNQARVGDQWAGICYCHEFPIYMTGPIIQGSNNVLVNGRGAARIGDRVVGSCGHSGNIISSSSTVNGNGRGLARIGDMVVGCVSGTIIQGSSNVLTGG